MKDKEFKRKQRIRLLNLIWAELGALILTAVVIVAYNHALFLAPLNALIISLTLFWIVNICVFACIFSGFNTRFKDPAFSLPQMYWATITTLIALTFTRHFDSIFYLLVMLSMVFGILRVPRKQFIIFCAVQVFVLFLAHLSRFVFFGEDETFVVFFSWLAFTFCSVTLASLCTSIVNLRSKLKENNENLSEALEVKSQFLATMSHEIRTPMNGVIGMLDIAIHKETNPEKKNYLDVAYSSAQSLLHIINDILSFSKVEQDKIEIDITSENLEKILCDTALVFSSIAKNNYVAIICQIDSSLPSLLYLDKSKLKQIVNNLVNNAVKFTPSGHIIIKAKKIVKADSSTPYIEISICDSGIGIETEKQKTIFEPFTQADSSTTRLYGGTGLGLCIADRLAKIMGSPIELKSHLGEGSTFSFLLEMKPSAATVLSDSYDQTNTLKKAILYSEDSILTDVILSHLQDINIQIDSIPLTHPDFIEKAKHSITLENGMPHRNTLIVIALNYSDNIDVLENSQKTLQILERLNAHSDTALPILIIGNNNQIDFSILPLSKCIPSFYSTNQLYNAITTLSDMPYDASQPSEACLDASNIPVTPTSFPSENTQENDAPDNAHTVLVVDDNVINVEVAKLIIEPLGYTTLTAFNGEEALEIIKQSSQQDSPPLSLILMDCQMPVMDGYEATKIIRNNNEYAYYKDIPIIAITANAMEGDKEKCLLAGMNDYIAKPIQSDILCERLAHWLSDNQQDNSIATEHKEVAPEQSKNQNNKLLAEPNSSFNANLVVWDKTDLLKLLNNNSQRTIELTQRFLDELKDQKKSLEYHFNNENWHECIALIHTIKGSAANMRMKRLATTANDIESVLKRNDISNTKSQLPHLLSVMTITINTTYEELNEF